MIDKIFDKIDDLKLSDSRKFHISTKIKKEKPVKKTDFSTWPEAWRRIFYKAYPRFKQVILPLPSESKHDLKQAFFQRKSTRDFSKKPIILPVFSDLLYFSAGMVDLFKENDSTKRFYPSAGARYPLELYPFVFNVRKIKKGVYHYHVKTHSLELLLDVPFFQRTMRQFNQPWIRKSALLLVISAVFDRTERKYKNRGYRHILTEYGHIAQNLYLISSAFELGCCSVGGFVDDGLNQILDIDGIYESVVGVVAFGNKVL